MREGGQKQRSLQLLLLLLMVGLCVGLVPADVSRGRVQLELPGASASTHVGVRVSNAAHGAAGAGEAFGQRPSVRVPCRGVAEVGALPPLLGGGGSANRLRGGGLPGYSIPRIPQPPDAPPPSENAVPAAVVVPAPPPAPPVLPDPVPVQMSQSQLARCVLPEVAAKGSVLDSVGWVFAFMTCSTKLRRQLRLDERLWLAAAMGDALLCEKLVAKGADLTAESQDGGDDPRVYFKV